MASKSQPTHIGEALENILGGDFNLNNNKQYAFLFFSLLFFSIVTDLLIYKNTL